MRSTSDERWLEAERRIAPRTSPERRRASRRSWLLLIVVAIAYGVTTALIGAFLGGEEASTPDADTSLPPAFWFGLAASGVGALVVLIGTIVGFAGKRLRPTWERVDGALTWRESRSARRQIRGEQPVAEQHRTVVRAIAEQDLRTAQALVPAYLGTALMAIGLMIALDLPEITAVITGLLVLLAATALWQYGVSARASRRYLART